MSEGSQYIGLTLAELEDVRKQAERTDRMDANSRQVGGSHYKKGTGEQHWDVVDRFQVPYLEGVGSKYPLRWREKGGVEDLKKTLHYIDKIMERPHDHEHWHRYLRLHTDLVKASSDLCEAHGAGPVERRVVLSLLQGVSRDLLQKVRGELADYITTVKYDLPVSPEDGGHHARQQLERIHVSGDARFLSHVGDRALIVSGQNLLLVNEDGIATLVRLA